MTAKEKETKDSEAIPLALERIFPGANCLKAGEFGRSSTKHAGK